MSDKMKIREGKDGYSYPYTSPDLVVDENGKSATKKFDDISSQFKDIAKKVENVGQPTQQQINTAIDKAIEEGRITGSGGINSTAKTLLETILRNAIYTTDQSANITSLVSALSSGNTPTTTHYTITNTLTKCTNGNSSSSVAKNTSYIATITPNTGYKLDTVTVTMGGVDITSSVYSNGHISINSVTGNIVITAVAIEKTQSELPQDGLIDVFDLRTATYNNSGSGGSTIINATQGSGGLFVWSKNVVRLQDAKYGMELSGHMSYSSDATTTETSANNSFTQVFMSYMENAGMNPMFNKNYGSLSNGTLISYSPKYINTSNSVTTLNTQDTVARTFGWHRIILTVDATTKLCKLYIDEKLVDTKDGNNYEDFSKWSTNIKVGMLNGSKYCTYFSLYNRALSEVEVTETFAYLKTLEVA